MTRHPHPMTLLTLTCELRTNADVYGWHESVSPLSRSASIYGWIFHPRAMLEIRRMKADTACLRAHAVEVRGSQSP